MGTYCQTWGSSSYYDCKCTQSDHHAESIDDALWKIVDKLDELIKIMKGKEE